MEVYIGEIKNSQKYICQDMCDPKQVAVGT